MTTKYQLPILLFFVLLLATTVLACSAYMSYAQVDCTVKEEFLIEQACLDEGCTYTTSFANGEGKISGGSVGQYSLYFDPNHLSYSRFLDHGTIENNDKNAALLFLEKACKEDTSGIRKFIEDGGSFTKASPYSGALIKDLQAGKDNIVYEQCKYTDFEIVNGWILQRSATRSHCDEWFGPDCGGIAPNPTKYAAQLGGNPGSINEESLSPLINTMAPWLVGGILLLIFLIFFRKKVMETIPHIIFPDKTKRNILALYVIAYIALSLLTRFISIDLWMLAVTLVVAYIVLTILLTVHRKIAAHLLARRKTFTVLFKEFLYPVLYGITGTIVLSLGVYFMIGRFEEAALLAVIVPIASYALISHVVGPIISVPTAILTSGMLYFIVGRTALAVRTGINQFKLDFIGKK